VLAVAALAGQALLRVVFALLNTPFTAKAPVALATLTSGTPGPW
jgi:hypothetical protein